MPNVTVPAAALGLPPETRSAGWYLFRSPNGADRLLWLEPGPEFWTVAVSAAYAREGKVYALLSDVALDLAAPRPLETGPHAASLSAWEAAGTGLGHV